MNLNEAVKETKRIADKMPPPKRGIYQRFTDLIEEVGEIDKRRQKGEFNHV